jgi:hypothetical protein
MAAFANDRIVGGGVSASVEVAVSGRLLHWPLVLVLVSSTVQSDDFYLWRNAVICRIVSLDGATGVQVLPMWKVIHAERSKLREVDLPENGPVFSNFDRSISTFVKDRVLPLSLLNRRKMIAFDK